MGEQSASRLKGDDYQHLYSWHVLLQLLDERGLYDHGYVEHPEAGAADDVALYPVAGSGAAAEYHQVKFHVDHSDSYSFSTLTAPMGQSGRSLLQRLFESWRKLRQSGEVQVWLVSNWSAAPDLGDYIDGNQNCMSSKFFAEPPGKRLKTVLAQWQQQLGATAEELRAFCRDLRLRLGYGGFVDLEGGVDDRMARYGLSTGPNARAIAIDEVRRWIKEGGGAKRVTRESLRESIRARQLWAQREEGPAVSLWIHGWTPQSYDTVPPAQELDWTRYCSKGPPLRLPSEQECREELLPQVQEAARHLERLARGTYVDFRGRLPLSLLLATGATFSLARGFRFRTQQITRGVPSLWRSHAAPSDIRLRAMERAGSPEAKDRSHSREMPRRRWSASSPSTPAHSRPCSPWNRSEAPVRTASGLREKLSLLRTRPRRPSATHAAGCERIRSTSSPTPPPASASSSASGSTRSAASSSTSGHP